MKAFKILLLIAVMIGMSGCYGKEALENSVIMTATGNDYLGESENPLINIIEFYIFKDENKRDRKVVTINDDTALGTYEKRQMKMRKNFIIGTIRAYILGERKAKYGIVDLLDTFVRDQERSLNTVVVVSKGDIDRIFELNPHDNITIGEEINSSVKAAVNAYFFSNENEIKDVLSMYYQEGRRIVIPYIEPYEEKGEKTFRIGGITVFEKDRLILMIPMEEAKYINLIRNSNSKGYLELVNKEDFTESASLLCTSRRKVKFNLENGKLVYDISIDIEAQVSMNSSATKIDNLAEDIKEIAKKIEKQTENKLKDTIEEVKEKYEVDVFDIEKYAVAKLGRDKEELIKKGFMDSIINVNVNLKLSTTGRFKD